MNQDLMMHTPSENTTERVYPKFPIPVRSAKRPISFVVVKFSDDYEHNLLKSECIANPLNELITIDNTGNLFYDHLTQAMEAGTAKARHKLIVVVHEDVLFPRGWQPSFESALNALEEVDPNWGVLGTVGWLENKKMFGHWSDPHQYKNTFSSEKFKRVVRLDEQILIFDQARLIALDQDLPSIHHIGRDILITAKKAGMEAYAIDAPVIHKFSDQNGEIIQTKTDSPKINERQTLAYKADRACCNEYIVHKWPELFVKDYSPPELNLPGMDDVLLANLDEPVVLLARGGSGSRLLSTLCQDIGLFLGSVINRPGDSIEMVQPIYQGIIEKHRSKTDWQKKQIVPRLRATAAYMLKRGGHTSGLWGFKLPESLLLLPEIHMAFPRARYLHLVRDPLTTCLRRTHMTARLDNCIGRVALPLAYEYLGLPRRMILEDPPSRHMTYTTIHQLSLLTHFFKGLPPNQWMQINFDDLIYKPGECINGVSEWLATTREEVSLEKVIDHKRAQNPKTLYSVEEQEKVEGLLHSIRKDYGFI